MAGALVDKERLVAGDHVLLDPEDPTDPLHVGTIVYLYEAPQVSPFSSLHRIMGVRIRMWSYFGRRPGSRH